VVAKWSYADLQRQVAARTAMSGNVPFELVRAHKPGLDEKIFVDQVSRSLREARFLLLIAGDGIREDVSSIAELVNRNSAMGFSFGLVEVALYGLANGSLLLQPRVVARTKVIERSVVMVRDASQAMVADDEEAPSSGDGPATNGEEGERQAAYRRWWQPVLDARLDDPEQEPAKLYWPNHIRAQLPLKGTWILCFSTGGYVGVCTAGRTGYYDEFMRFAEDHKTELLAGLPATTEFRPFSSGTGKTFICERPVSSFPSEVLAKAWIVTTLNAFVNVLRPSLKRLGDSASNQ